MWIGLTDDTTEELFFVNMDRMVTMDILDKTGHTELNDGGNYPFTVKETPEQIMALMGEQSCRCQETEEPVAEEYELPCPIVWDEPPTLHAIGSLAAAHSNACKNNPDKRVVTQQRIGADVEELVSLPYVEEDLWEKLRNGEISHIDDPVTSPEHNPPCPECRSLNVIIDRAERDDVGWIVTFICPDCSHMWWVQFAKVRMKLWPHRWEGEATEKSPEYRWDRPITRTCIEFETGVWGYASGFTSGCDYDWQLWILREYSKGGKATSLAEAQVACEEAYEKYKETQHE